VGTVGITPAKWRLAMGRYVKSTAKVSWREQNKSTKPKNRDEEQALKKGKATYGPAAHIKGSGTDLKNIGYIDPNCTREPFAGMAFNIPEEIRKSPAKMKLWKAYVKEMKIWWKNEMRAERKGFGKQWAKAGLKSKRSEDQE